MIKALNHVGISVRNLERALRFYECLLGMQVIAREDFRGQLYEKICALRGARGKVALVKTGNLQIELFEFLEPVPDPDGTVRPVCDYGISHFCIEVSDVNSEYQRLKAEGVTFHCPPLDFSAAERATYGRDPDGNVFELLQIRDA